jgi:MarR family transcriptional regulator, organic hydroperoxide resistance regulator
MLGDATRALLELYPRIFFACHTRHVKDPGTKRILSAHQASILDHLDAREPTTVSELARHMGVMPSTMSLALDRLERGGYVERRRDPDDGRRVGVVLTAPGRRIRDAQSVLDPDRVRLLLAELDEADRERALEGLALLAAAASRIMSSKRLPGLRSRRVVRR